VNNPRLSVQIGGAQSEHTPFSSSAWLTETPPRTDSPATTTESADSGEEHELHRIIVRRVVYYLRCRLCIFGFILIVTALTLVMWALLEKRHDEYSIHDSVKNNTYYILSYIDGISAMIMVVSDAAFLLVLFHCGPWTWRKPLTTVHKRCVTDLVAIGVQIGVTICCWSPDNMKLATTSGPDGYAVPVSGELYVLPMVCGAMTVLAFVHSLYVSCVD